MELVQTHLLPVPLQTARDTPDNPAVLQRCIPSCENITAVEVGASPACDIAMTIAVGPAKAHFKGRMELADVTSPCSYALHLDGQGDAAGFGKDGIQMQFMPEGPTITWFLYAVMTQVGGRFVQTGSWLVDGAVRKLAGEFFQRFAAEFGPMDLADVDGHATLVDDMPATQAIPDLATGQLQARGVPSGHAPDVSPALQPRSP